MSTTLVDLQRRNQERMAQAAPTPAGAEVRTDGMTETRTDGQTEGQPPALTEGSTAVRQAVRTEGQTDGRKGGLTDGRPPAREAVSTEGWAAVHPPAAPAPSPMGREASLGDEITDETFLEHVRAAVAARRPLSGGNKTTVDMTPDLAKRAALYSLDHGKVSTRQLFVELLDAFLAVEGY